MWINFTILSALRKLVAVVNSAFCPFPKFPFQRLIFFHFGLLVLHFLSFWPFGPSFPFIFGLLGFHFFSFWSLRAHFVPFWPFRLSFPFILGFWASFRELIFLRVMRTMIASSWGVIHYH